MKFVVLYRSSVSAQEMMANSTPEQREAGMADWMSWIQKAGDGLLDVGAPLAEGGSVPDGAAGNGSHVTGYSILQAPSHDAAKELLRDHPHLNSPGNPVIEVLEVLPVPGM